MTAAVEALVWCLRHFKTLDESNAAIHCAPVKYSPLTFRIAQALDALDDVVFDDDRDETGVRAVLAHVGAYQMDPGR